MQGSQEITERWFQRALSEFKVDDNELSRMFPNYHFLSNNEV